MNRVIVILIVLFLACVTAWAEEPVWDPDEQLASQHAKLTAKYATIFEATSCRPLTEVGYAIGRVIVHVEVYTCDDGNYWMTGNLSDEAEEEIAGVLRKDELIYRGGDK